MWLIVRLANTAVTLLVISFVLFVLARSTPVSPARIVLGADATEQQIREFERDKGLDQPIVTQYARWLADFPLAGFGPSFITNLSINSELAAAIPVSFQLVALAFVMAVAGALALGGTAAFFEDSALDHAIRVVTMLALSVPGFWLGFMLIRLGAVKLGWFPPGGLPAGSGLARLHALVLPALAIAVYYVGAMSRLVRASVIEVLGQDYTRTSRALGLRPARLVAYTMKNALPPFVAMAAMSFGYMFGWAIIIELVFSLPGLSRSLLTAIQSRDYPMIQATVLVITVIFVLSNTAADILQRVLNPRIADGSV